MEELVMSRHLRKIIYISIFAFLLQTSLAIAGTTGSEELKVTSSQDTAEEGFESFSRAMFKLNHDLRLGNNKTDCQGL